MARVNMKEINKAAERQIGALPGAQLEAFQAMSEVPPVLALATALGETRSSLARRTGISLSTLAKWDAGSVSPRRSQIGKLLSGSPVSEAEFLARFEAFHPGVMAKPRKKRVTKSVIGITQEMVDINNKKASETAVKYIKESLEDKRLMIPEPETEDWDSL